MSFDCLLYSLRLDADVALRGRCGTVLQEPLNKGDVIVIVFVYLCCVPFAEAVGAATLINLHFVRFPAAAAAASY